MAAENAHEVTASLPKRSDLSARRLRAGAIPDDVMEDDFNLIQLVEVCGPTELILVRPGEFLFREGDEGQALYIVKKGNLRIMSGSVLGSDALLDKLSTFMWPPAAAVWSAPSAPPGMCPSR